MNVMPLTIGSYGLVTGVGLDAPSSCAAIRGAIDNFQETRFVDSGGEWILASEVPLEQPWRGKTKLIKMLALAINECLAGEAKVKPETTPLLLCLSESERAGRVIDDDNQFFQELNEELGLDFHDKSRVISQGHVGFTTALLRARSLIQEGIAAQVLIAGVDGFLVGPTLAYYEEQDRLLTSQNSNGFIPGEAAGAVLVQAPGKSSSSQLLCLGIGYGNEQSTVYAEDIPLRGDGMAQAIRSALSEAGCDMGATDFRIVDVSGEQYAFKEAALALLRVLRQRKVFYDIWHPAECVGEVGAAIGPIILGVLLAAMHKGYSPGNNVLAHFANDEGKRAAMVLTYQAVGGN